MQSVYIRSISVLSILFLFTSAAAQNLDQVISKSIQPFLTDKVVSGAVTLVGQSGKITHLASHGMADLEGGRSMQKEDLFWIASMTKPIFLSRSKEEEEKRTRFATDASVIQSSRLGNSL